MNHRFLTPTNNKNTSQQNHTMKLNKSVLGLLAGSALISSASAATFEITGATAFRSSTLQSIRALYIASGQAFRFGHDGANEGAYTGANYVTFEGTINGIPGTTVIRCSFNGSIEGLRALADSPTHDPNFLKLSALTEAAIVGGTNQEAISTSGNLETAQAEMAFSDVDKALSPYAANTTLTGDSVGVVVFGIVASEGASAITNVTSAQYRSLLFNGYMPLSYFTGVAADDNRLIFCTGRNDGSGTRTSYMTEVGFGVTNTVQQFLVIGSEVNQITALQTVPQGGVNADLSGTDLDGFDAQPNTAGTQAITQLATSASTVWGQDLPGNGGAFSGSVLRGHLGLDGDSVNVFDADGFNLFGTPRTNIGLVSYISLNDAVSARTAGATICSFNGVSLAVNGPSNTMTDADKSKVYEGNYTAWNFQQFYRKTTADANTISLYNSLAAAIPGTLGSAGLAKTAMQCARSADGGIINPIF
jgi:hypothetical protein